MSRRFFCEEPLRGDTVTLSDAEAHHLLHVMRAQVGDRVILFDGWGVECEAEVTELKRKEVILSIQAPREVDREVGIDLELAVALPRGDRPEWLIQKAVELGVTRLVPWVTERSVVQPNAKTILKLRRTVIEASKQCGRNRLMDIVEPQAFDAYLVTPPGGVQLLAHPVADDGVPSHGMMALCDGAAAIRLGVGPEGGFSDDEVASAVGAGWTPIDLGPRILRTETAAIAMAALVSLGVARR